ncbi:hypothetical protein FB451DRAFT_1190851 [Mycena latifolia]|nr:hypothetical protein FB451DRAFT_1190851 [Mycena latifolia]
MSDTNSSFQPASALPRHSTTDDQGSRLTTTRSEDAAHAAFVKTMAAKDKLGFSTIKYITSEDEANIELAAITGGAVGFDTEFAKHILYGDEETIDKLPTMGHTAKKNARQAIQHLERLAPNFSIKWDNIGLCMIPAYPEELRRIMTSKDISKVGVGITNDALVIWEDLRTDLKTLIDIGLLTKLWTVEKHIEEPLAITGLEQAAKEILDITIDKSFQKTVDWKATPTEAHKLYAALDAGVALRLYERLGQAMASEKAEKGEVIPPGWYTFNSMMGEAMRTRLSVRGLEVAWSTKECTWYSANKFQGKYF